MIEKTDVREDTPAVRKLYDMQRQAYAVEAAIIGFAEIPPLLEAYDDFRSCGETFLICTEENELGGALTYERDGQALDICRLVVNPRFFRRGVASRLLQALMKQESGWSVIRTSTGTANAPAVALYRKLGFTETGLREVAPGVTVTLFELER